MAGETNRHNVLIIMADQHRWDCLGAAGNREVRTPNLDVLAGDGVRYANTFCAYPVCTPSRYSFLSGTYVHQHRGWNNHATPVPGTLMFPELFQRTGYRCKAVGKMHFTPTYLDVGFDEMLLAEQDGPGRWDDDYHRYLMEHGLVDRNDLEDQRQEYRNKARAEYWTRCGAIPSNLGQRHHSTTWIGDRALETVQTWSSGGNMLMVSFIKPHHPFDPPAEWMAKYEPESVHLLPGWTDQCLPRDLEYQRGYFPHDQLAEPVIRLVTATYYATIEQMDFQIGRLFQALKEKGLYDDTLIVYTADHGEYLGFHHLLLKGNHMYEPLVRIPLFVKYPGRQRAGICEEKLVSNIDVAPTLLNQCGLSLAPGMRGKDLFSNRSGHDTIFCENREGRLVMARDAKYKFLCGRKNYAPMLFDLEADPLEMNNLAAAGGNHGAVIAEFERRIQTWRSPEMVLPPYLDECAIDIQQPNVQWHDDSHRDRVIRYYREAMSKLDGA